MLLTEEIIQFLENRYFLHVASSDLNGRPTVAPKPILKIQDNCIYLADYLRGKTYQNLKENPFVCLSTLDITTIIGYVLHGTCTIIEKNNKEYNNLVKELKEKQLNFATQSIIQAVRGSEHRESFDMINIKAVSFFKITLEEVVKVETSGDLQREKI